MFLRVLFLWLFLTGSALAQNLLSTAVATNSSTENHNAVAPSSGVTTKSDDVGTTTTTTDIPTATATPPSAAAASTAATARQLHHVSGHHDEDNHFKAEAIILPPPVQLKKKFCPQGYQMEGTNCVAWGVVPTELVCPHGTIDHNGRCAVFMHPSEVCPRGFEMVGHKCVTMEEVPPTVKCKEGELDVTGRQCRIVYLMKSHCPDGYSAERGLCIQRVPMLLKCPPGYSKGRGHYCTQELMVPATPVCKKGYYDHTQGICIYQKEHKSVCPHGFKPAGSRCVQFAPALMAPCPQGYHLASPGSEHFDLYGGDDGHGHGHGHGHHHHQSGDDDKVCQRVQMFDPEPVCPPEMHLDTAINTCLQEVFVPPQCPAGTVSSKFEHGMCERSHRPRMVCPMGTELVSQGEPRCREPSYMPADPTCPDTFMLLGDYCQRMKDVPPMMRCQHGTLMMGNECVSKSFLEPAFVCPEGFNLGAGPKCIRQSQYDCSRTVFEKQCEEMVVEHVTVVQHVEPKKHHHGHGVRRVLAGAEGESQKDSAIEAATEERPVSTDVAGDSEAARRKLHHDHGHEEPVAPLKCKKVPVTVPKVCLKEEKAPVQYACTSGGELVGQQCVIVERSAPEPVCPGESVLDSNMRCALYEKVPMKLQCPMGSSMYKDGQCVAYHYVAQESICAPGTELVEGECVQRMKMQEFPSRRVRQPPRMVCPRGHLMEQVVVNPSMMAVDGKGHGKHGRRLLPLKTGATKRRLEGFAPPPKCKEVENLPVKLMCPKGFMPVKNRKKSGLPCAMFVDPEVKPSKAKHTKAKYMCPYGKTKGKDCPVFDTQPKIPYCPPGTKPRGDECILVAKLITPPPKVTLTPAHVYCPHGYSLSVDGTRCVTQIKEKPVWECPIGFELIGSLHKCAIFKDPEPVCPKPSMPTADGICKVKKVTRVQVMIKTQCVKGTPGCDDHGDHGDHDHHGHKRR